MPKVRHWRLYARGPVYWIDLRLDQPLPGKKRPRVEVSTDTLVSSGEAAARIQAKRMIDEIEAGAPAVSAGGALAVRSYGEIWIAERRKLGKLTWKDEQAHLRDHLYPEKGARPIREVSKAEMLEWVGGLPTHARHDGRPGTISGRTCHNVANTVRHLFKRAVKAEVLEVSPCVWDKTDLPKKGSDKAARRRLEGGFTAEQVGVLIYDTRIPEDRRVLYALEFLTGMRTGEAADRRFRDWKAAEKPLGLLIDDSAWSTRHHIEKDNKTTTMRWLPVHPALDSILRDWMREGFDRAFGRAPAPEDFIVPSRGGGGRKWPAGQPRNNSYSWRMFQRDLRVVGFTAQRHYESRATFRSLALAGGADLHAVNVITHPSPQDAADLYERRHLIWPALCAAVSCITVNRPRQGLSIVGGKED